MLVILEHSTEQNAKQQKDNNDWLGCFFFVLFMETSTKRKGMDLKMKMLRKHFDFNFVKTENQNSHVN